MSGTILVFMTFPSRPSRVPKTHAWLWILSKFKIEWFKLFQKKSWPFVAEPPKCLGPPAPAIVLRTSDGDAGSPLTLEVRWALLCAHSTATCGVPSWLVLTTDNGQTTRTASSRPYRIASGHLNTRIIRCEDKAVTQRHKTKIVFQSETAEVLQNIIYKRSSSK